MTRRSPQTNAEPRFHLFKVWSLIQPPTARSTPGSGRASGSPVLGVLSLWRCRARRASYLHRSAAHLLLERARNRSLTVPQSALAPELLEPIRRQLRVMNGVLEMRSKMLGVSLSPKRSHVARRRRHARFSDESNLDRIREERVTLVQGPHEVRLREDCSTFAIAPFSSIGIQRKVSHVVFAGLFPNQSPTVRDWLDRVDDRPESYRRRTVEPARRRACSFATALGE